jgi:hypothetical protein
MTNPRDILQRALEEIDRADKSGGSETALALKTIEKMQENFLQVVEMALESADRQAERAWRFYSAAGRAEPSPVSHRRPPISAAPRERMSNEPPDAGGKEAEVGPSQQPLFRAPPPIGLAADEEIIGNTTGVMRVGESFQPVPVHDDEQ